MCQFSLQEMRTLLFQSNNGEGGGFYFLHIHFLLSCSTCIQSSPVTNQYFHLFYAALNQVCTEISNPIARGPRPSLRFRALEHGQSERCLTLELLPSPLVLIVCPPPGSNSLMHLPKVTHPNHNGHYPPLSHLHLHLCPRSRRRRRSQRSQTHRPSDGNSNGLL